ncbi:relaxase/mobilization nuclease domain-containing protein [uncultured Treponema sp.]|uniref:relaxase/mobilization nuclease domain-containing protein n=1 Tax=uncultured Treponema sp. TaxID=162155 RepID=UPI0015B8E4AE|nr:hypothetical protein [uncultured Treponema sp.]
MKSHSIKDVFSSRPTKEHYEEDLYKVRKVPYKKDDMWRLSKLLAAKPTRVGRDDGGRFSGGGRGGALFLNSVNQRDQRVMFKVSHSSSMQAHDKYLSTYMPQENKNEVLDKPRLFGTENSEYETAKVPEHFKFIISPENQNVNLKVLASEFIRHVETMTGYKLLWQGAVHTDTAHRHAHICINGRDMNGKRVYFQPEMIKRTMRETLSYIATQMVGERTEQEIISAQKNLVVARRWTKLDEELEKYPGKISPHLLSPDMQNRLAFLSEMNLAVRKAGFYELKDVWKEVLVATGRYNTFFDEYQKSGGKLELYSGGGISGTVENVISFDKDESWNDALVIRSGESLVYVPVWQLKKDDLLGKSVEIKDGTRSLSRQVTDSSIRVVGTPRSIRNSGKRE